MMTLAQRLLLRQPPGGGIQVSLARTLRGLRPAWLAAPIYQRILRPFDSDLKRIFGATSTDMFDAVVRIADSRPGIGAMPVDWLAPIPEECLVRYEEIREPSDLWDAGVVRVGNSIIPLGHRLAESTYRAALRGLASALSGFTTSEGRSVERVVREEVQNLAPEWNWISNYTIEGESNDEKDLVGLGPGVGLAIESKAGGLTRLGMDWSRLNLSRDLQPIRTAQDQLSAPLAVLLGGGGFAYASGSVNVPAKKLGFGLAVTDDVYVPLIEAYNPQAAHLHHPPTDQAARTRDLSLVLSIVDLALLVRLSRIPPVFLDYLDWRIRYPQTRTLDAPESWLFYSVDPMLHFTRDGAHLSSEANEWMDVRELGYESMRPPWIYRWDRIQREEAQGNTLRAVRLVQGDRSASERKFPNAVHTAQMTEFWRRHTSLFATDGYQTTVRDRYESDLGGPSSASLVSRGRPDRDR